MYVYMYIYIIYHIPSAQIYLQDVSCRERRIYNTRRECITTRVARTIDVWGRFGCWADLRGSPRGPATEFKSSAQIDSQDVLYRERRI